MSQFTQRVIRNKTAPILRTGFMQETKDPDEIFTRIKKENKYYKITKDSTELSNDYKKMLKFLISDLCFNSIEKANKLAKIFTDNDIDTDLLKNRIMKDLKVGVVFEQLLKDKKISVGLVEKFTLHFLNWIRGMEIPNIKEYIDELNKFEFLHKENVLTQVKELTIKEIQNNQKKILEKLKVLRRNIKICKVEYDDELELIEEKFVQNYNTYERIKNQKIIDKKNNSNSIYG